MPAVCVRACACMCVCACVRACRGRGAEWGEGEGGATCVKSRGTSALESNDTLSVVSPAVCAGGEEQRSSAPLSSVAGTRAVPNMHCGGSMPLLPARRRKPRPRSSTDVLPPSGPPIGVTERSAASHCSNRMPLFVKCGGCSASSSRYASGGVCSAGRVASETKYVGGGGGGTSKSSSRAAFLSGGGAGGTRSTSSSAVDRRNALGGARQLTSSGPCRWARARRGALTLLSGSKRQTMPATRLKPVRKTRVPPRARPDGGSMLRMPKSTNAISG